MTSDSASRVTRSSRNLRLAVLVFLGALAAATGLRAQEPSKAAPVPAPANEPTAKPAAEPPVAASSDEAESTAPAGDKSSPASATDRKPPGAASSGRFEPTEKVRADFDVSFPVDI
jgi:hypothetical protein